MLRVLLNSKNISLYQLEKTSNISHATLNDIFNERSNIDNCSIIIIKKIANALDISIDDAYKILTYNDLSLVTYNEAFDLFKSNTLQQLKRSDPANFIKRMIDTKMIESCFEDKRYLEAIYLFSLIDYLSKKINFPFPKQYDFLKNYQLDKLYVSKSLYLLLAMKMTTITNIYKESIKEFLKHNIVEANIDDIV